MEMNNNLLKGNHITSKERFGYIAMVIPFYVMAGIFFLGYQNFFYDNLQLDPKLITLGLAIYGVINAFNDPLVAIWSDNLDRKRWGSRRKIFLKWGSMFWAVSFIAIWFPWSTTNQTIMFFHFLITMSMWDMGLTICLMCWLALLPEMEEDINRRLKVSWLVSIFMLIAMITGTVLAGFMETNFNLFRIINIVIAVLVVISTLLTLRLVNEREEYADDKALSFWESIKETIKSKSFMIFIGYNFFANVMTRSIGMAFIFIYVLILPVDMMVYFLITAGIGILVSFIGMKLRPKFGMRNILMVSTSLQIIGGLLFYFLSLSSRESIFTLIGFLWITFFGGFHTGFFQTLQGLSMDEDELKTGSRRENAFLGVNALFTKPADSLGPMLAIWILELTKYVKDSEITAQPDTAVVGMKSILILLPVIFAALSLIFIYFYPIHGKYMKKIYADLEIMHKEKREHVKLQ